MPNFNSFVYDLIAAFEPDIINGHCYASFILSPQYKQEGAPFGFDWIRMGNYTNYIAYDEAYKGNLGRNFSSIEGDKLATNRNSTNIFFMEDPEMYSELCRSYMPGSLRVFPSVDGKLRSYHVPVLSIYPYTGNPDDIAHLILEIDITTPPEEIYLEYDQTLLEIKGAEELETEYGVQTISISVKCIKEFSEDQYVRVIAVNKKGKKRNAGVMRVCKNAENFRRQIAILAINIKFLPSMEEDAIPYCGNCEILQKSLTKYLRHALITPLITVEEVDLGYKAGLESRLINHNGTVSLIDDKEKSDGTLDKTLISIHKLLLYNIMHIPGTYCYDIIIFSIGTRLCSIKRGNEYRFVSGYNINKIITLSSDHTFSTPTHEVLHALGLSHTFNNTHLDDSPTDYTYYIYSTDNIMDYSHLHNIVRMNLWEWQWKKARFGAHPEDL